jgi:hypothetical protein
MAVFALIAAAVVLAAPVPIAVKAVGMPPEPVSPSTESSTPFPMNGLTATDAEAAMALAVATGESVEDVSQREPSVEIFAEPNGTWQRRQWLAPVWVQTGGDGDGADDWQPLDIELVANAEGDLSPRAYPSRLVFAGSALVGEPLVDWAMPGSEVSLSVLAPANVSAPVVEGARARYVNVYPGVDLVFDVRPTGFEQYYVVHDRDSLAAINNALHIDYAVENGTLASSATALEVLDAQGVAVAAIPAAEGWDAAQDAYMPTPVLSPWAVEGENPAATVSDRIAETVPLPWHVQSNAEATRVSIPIPLAWSDSATTQFPLVIDPIPLSPYFGWDGHVRSDNPNTSYYTGTELFIGQDPTYGPVYMSLLNINTSGIIGKDIISANAYVWNNWSATCTQVAWYAYSTAAPYTYSTWNNLPTIHQGPYSSTHTRGHTSGSSPYCSQDWAWIDVTPFAQAWSGQPGTTNQGILLKAADDTTAQWKRFLSADSSSANKPHLSIWYNQPPYTPTGLSYTAPVLTARGKVSATVTDPDGTYYQLRALFTIERRVIGSQDPWQVVLDQAEGSLVAHGAVSTREVDLTAGFEYRVKAWTQDTRIKSAAASGYITFAIPSTSNFQDVPATDDDDV